MAFRFPGPIPHKFLYEALRRLKKEGLLGDGFRPGPIGRTPPKASPTSGSKSTAGQLEVHLFGDFPKPNSWTPQKEKNLIAASHWFPHNLDFEAVLGNKSTQIASDYDLLLKIYNVKSTIRRLNFFSHGATGMIGTDGTIADNGKSVTLNGGLTQIISSKAIVVPYADAWGNFGENSHKKITVGNKKFSLDDVRAKFGKNAVIWLYVCNGGTDPMLHQNVANTFQVTVKAFRSEIVFCAPSNFPTSRKHKLVPKTTTKPIDSCPNAKLDFHDLDKHNGVMSLRPKRP